jgi:hypothetical protein
VGGALDLTGPRRALRQGWAVFYDADPNRISGATRGDTGAGSVAAMGRIAIVGCGGSGKTHLANQLATLLDLPLVHPDVLYYDAEWNPLPAEEFAALQEKWPRLAG